MSLTRQLLRKLLLERIEVKLLDQEQYVFSGKAVIGRLMEGVLPKILVSPTGCNEFCKNILTKTCRGIVKAA